MNTISVRVELAVREAQDIRLLRLAPTESQGLPAYTPGSHIDLHLGPGLVRQYSLCGPHADFSSYCVAVKREPCSRGGSEAVHEALAVGSVLQISPPRNNFPLAQRAPYSVLIAGGIGITPLISMARALHAEALPFELLYFCRSAEHAAFRGEMESGPFASRSQLHFGLDHAAVAEVLQRTLAGAPKESHLYMCGPGSFMRAVQEIASNEGWPDERVHLEHFSPPTPSSDPNGESRFGVKLSRSGVTLEVHADETIVDALHRNGIEVETSCEQGICGTCMTNVLEGAPDHRDSFLTPGEKARGDCMVICVSRSASPLLVLDL